MVTLRDLEERDLPLLLAWRQDREVMRYLPSAPPSMSWEQQWSWWLNRTERIDRMVEVEWWRVGAQVYEARRTATRPVGVVHFNLPTGEIGILMGERSLWGQGLGKQALRMFLEELRASPRIWAVVHPENAASLALFRALGFKDVGEGRNGQRRLELR